MYFCWNWVFLVFLNSGWSFLPTHFFDWGCYQFSFVELIYEFFPIHFQIDQNFSTQKGRDPPKKLLGMNFSWKFSLKLFCTLAEIIMPFSKKSLRIFLEKKMGRPPGFSSSFNEPLTRKFLFIFFCFKEKESFFNHWNSQLKSHQ